MAQPRPGDILLRGSCERGFEIVDATSLDVLDGPFPSLVAAIAAARDRGVTSIWQQSFDNRGRPLGDAFYLFLQLRGLIAPCAR